MVLSPTVVQVPPEAAVAVARAVASAVTDAVLLLRVSAPRAGQMHSEWPQLVWFNSAAADRFALSATHVGAHGWFEQAFELNRELWLSLTNIMREPSAARAEVPFLQRGRAPARLDLVVTPLTEDADSTTRYWTVLARDVAADGSRETHIGMAAQGQRLETLGLVAGSIAHDFATLAHIISGYTELALREHSLEEAQRSMRIVQETSSRASALAKQLLQFTRQQPVAPRSVDLGVVLTQLVPLLERLAGPRVKVAWSVRAPDVAPVVWGHVGQMEQILLNLVVNASEAQPEGGSVSISVDVLATDQLALRRAVAKPSPWMVRLCVDDDGPGIPPALRDRVLDPFFSTKVNGTGLGLATVSAIVRQSGGELRLGNAVRHAGLRVEVLFPWYTPAPV